MSSRSACSRDHRITCSRAASRPIISASSQLDCWISDGTLSSIFLTQPHLINSVIIAANKAKKKMTEEEEQQRSATLQEPMERLTQSIEVWELHGCKDEDKDNGNRGDDERIYYRCQFTLGLITQLVHVSISLNGRNHPEYSPRGSVLVTWYRPYDSDGVREKRVDLLNEGCSYDVWRDIACAIGLPNSISVKEMAPLLHQYIKNEYLWKPGPNTFAPEEPPPSSKRRSRARAFARAESTSTSASTSTFTSPSPHSSSPHSSPFSSASNRPVKRRRLIQYGSRYAQMLGLVDSVWVTDEEAEDEEDEEEEA